MLQNSVRTLGWLTAGRPGAHPRNVRLPISFVGILAGDDVATKLLGTASAKGPSDVLCLYILVSGKIWGSSGKILGESGKNTSGVRSLVSPNGGGARAGRESGCCGVLGIPLIGNEMKLKCSSFPLLKIQIQFKW